MMLTESTSTIVARVMMHRTLNVSATLLPIDSLRTTHGIATNDTPWAILLGSRTGVHQARLLVIITCYKEF